ncbi:MAG: zinc dependent phospholipase C family protein [Peptostreptococcaceae bacterium]|nr:zinc dependent phospholipase C family protein [Peptostreptococcaceae bacterium]
MPDIMSHILMGYDVLNDLPSSNSFKQSVAKHSGLVNNGLQGPDPFYYLGNFPLGKRSLEYIGNLMHKAKTGVFLLDLIESLGSSDSCTEMKAACLCGLICHYCLDTICHPCIFYFSGFDYSGNQPTVSSISMKKPPQMLSS